MTANQAEGSRVGRALGWWLAALASGVGVAVLAGAWRVFDPTNLDWIIGDRGTAFLGWGYLRIERGWHFPPTWVTGLGYPTGVSVAQTDLVPLLALPLSLLDPLLPRGFQYFGLLLAVNCVLQAWFGFRLAEVLAGPSRPFAAFAGGCLFLLAPPLWIRFSGHFALSSHWLLLAALLLYLRAGEAAGRRQALLSLLLLWLAGGINPYLLAMTALILLAALAKVLLRREVGLPTAVGLAAAGLAVCLASPLVHGFLVLPFEPGGLTSGGYASFGTGLLGLVDPLGFSGLLTGVELSAGSWEGLAWLGLGVLALLPLALAGLAGCRRPWQDWLPLAAAALLGLLFALTNEVRLGDRVLLAFDLPPGWDGLAGVFHAAGRFVWPLHYAVILLVLAGLLRWRRRGVALAALAAAVALQLADLAPLRARMEAKFQPTHPSALRAAAWRTLASDHDHLVELPAWQCQKKKLGGFWNFGRLALEQGLTINSVYLARYAPDFLSEHCQVLPRALIDSGLAARTAYVFTPDSVRFLALLPRSPQFCDRQDDYVLCRESKDAAGLAPPLRQSLFAPLAPGGPPQGQEAAPFLAILGPLQWGLAFRSAEAGSQDLRLFCAEADWPFPGGTLRLVVDGVARAELPVVAEAPHRWRTALGTLPADALVGLVLPSPWRFLSTCRLSLERAGS